MLIERFVKRERRKTVLIVPAAARESVWETTIRKYMPDILEGFSPFKVINHTDLLLEIISCGRVLYRPILQTWYFLKC